MMDSYSFSSSPQSSLSSNWKHDVFMSYYGPDLRRSFLCHIVKEFKIKGIDPFTHNEIIVSNSLRSEHIEAIRSSKISIVMLSINYASSSWCLNELVEIMRCKEELGQVVVPIFYELEPVDVVKQTGDFGEVFRKTCKAKTKEDTERWRQVLAQVARLAGEHSGSCNCSGLVKLPDSIGNATSLRELDIANCTSLVELPSSIGNATNLSKLDLSNCSSLVELPFSIGNATNLEYLYLSNCSSLLHLPSSIGHATSLQYLYLNNCSNLLDVPASIGNASNLKKLDLSWCTSLVELPDSIRNSTSLWQLNLDNCSSLLEVPSSIGNGVRIKKLDLSWCTSLVDELPVEIPSSSANDIPYTTF